MLGASALKLNTPLSPPALSTGTRSCFQCPSMSEMSAWDGSGDTGHGAAARGRSGSLGHLKCLPNEPQILRQA